MNLILCLNLHRLKLGASGHFGGYSIGSNAKIIIKKKVRVPNISELFLFNMKLRRRYINEAKGCPVTQKALAVAIRIKSLLKRDSTIHDFTINKLHRLTGISAKTLNRYLPILEDMGIVSFCGKDDRHMVIGCLHSHSASRNINIDKFDFSSFRSVYYSLRAFIALSIQHRKDYIRRTIQIATDPRKGQDCKAARKTVKRLVRQGVLKCTDGQYRESGISFRRIAKETGNCVRTAERIVDFAVLKGWVTKVRHYTQLFVKGVMYRVIDGFTFSTRNNIYAVQPNSYILNPSVSSDLAMVGDILDGKK